MHLEKATSRSSDAALAGWISSNDVTLVTMVLVVVVAVFLHNRLARGTRQNSELADARQQLAATLEDTSERLAAAENALQATRRNLESTTAEQARLHQEAATRLEELAGNRLALSESESQNDRLARKQQELSTEVAGLLERQSALIDERDALTAASAATRQELASAQGQLADATATLAETQADRDRMQRQADELDQIVAALRAKLAASGDDLDQAHLAAAAEQATADQRIGELQSKVDAGQRQADEYIAQLARAAAQLQTLQDESAKLAGSLSKSEAQRHAALLEEGRHNRELVGLKGSLERVAIVVDASGSMRQAGAAGGVDRWADVQQIVSVWLQHLRVRQCVLIVFSSQARAYPEDGSLVDLRGDDAGAKREDLLERLAAVSPAGYTNTLDALRKAYEYPVDSILLFSDGAPSRADSGAFDPQLAAQIYELCARHPGVPVNAIGVGNYFDQQMSAFLHTVAERTGGTFRGQ